MSAASVDRYGVYPLSDEIEELKRKITLLDGDQKAFVENARVAKRQNHEKIQTLREKNKRSRALLASLLVGDEKVVASAFNETAKKQPPSFQDVKSAVAIERLDQRACELAKALNALKYETEKKQKQLAALQTKVAENARDYETTRQNDDGQSVMAQQLRQLENRLDKAIIKSQEAMQVQKTYQQVIGHMEEERLHYDKQLEALTKAIKEKQRTYRELASVRNDANLARDTAKVDLKKQENHLVESRKVNEQSMVQVRIDAELRAQKAMSDDSNSDEEDGKKRMKRKTQEKLVKSSMAQPNIEIDEPPEEQALAPDVSELPPENIDQKTLDMYEAQLARIKEVTGVTNEQEVIERFLSQDKTTEHLERLKEINETQLRDLKQDKVALEKQFEDLKYSGEAKISSGQKLLEEFKEHLNETKKKQTETQQNADRTTKLLLDVNAGILHLQEKVVLLRAPKPSIPIKHPPPDADDYMLDVLSTVEQKLIKLLEELDGQNLEHLRHEVDEMRLQSRPGLDTAGNSQSIRIALKTSTSEQTNDLTAQAAPEEKKETTYRKDDEESGEDDEDVFTRQALKRQSQLLVDTKTKKKRRRRAKDN